MSVLAAIIGTILKSIVIEMMLRRSQLSFKQLKAFFLGSRLIQKDQIKELTIAYTLKCAKVQYFKKLYEKAKRMDHDRLSEFKERYIEAVKVKLRERKNIKIKIQLYCN